MDNKINVSSFEAAASSSSLIDDTSATNLNQLTTKILVMGAIAHGKKSLIRMMSGNKFTFKTHSLIEFPYNFNLSFIKIYKNISIIDDNSGKSNLKYKCCSNRSKMSKEAQLENDEWIECRHLTLYTMGSGDYQTTHMYSKFFAPDAVIFVIAADEDLSNPDVRAQIATVELMKVKNAIIVQTKLDKVDEEDALHHFWQIRNLVEGTILQNAPIIPCSYLSNYTIHVLCEHIMEFFPIPYRDLSESLKISIIGSFNENRPYCDIGKLQGASLLGYVAKGVIHVGDQIELRPGIIRNYKNSYIYSPIFAKVCSLEMDDLPIQSATPGTFIKIVTTIDPSLGGFNKLQGEACGLKGALFSVFCEFVIDFKVHDFVLDHRHQLRVGVNDVVVICIEGARVGAQVTHVHGSLLKLSLRRPICANINDEASLLQRIRQRWVPVGKVTILSGVEACQM